MSLGQTIFNLLVDNTDAFRKVFPSERPQKTELPAITYAVISTVPVKQKSTTADLQQIRVQISIFAISYSDVEFIANQVRTCLDQPGYWNYTNSDGTITQTSTFDSERDDFIQNADYDGIYAKYQDYILFITR